MAKRTGTLNVDYKKRGCLWWVCIGWWWRPIHHIFIFILADIFGFKNIRRRYHK